MRKTCIILILPLVLLYAGNTALAEDRDSLFREAARAFNVPVAWTKAIARVESNNDVYALNIEGKGYHCATREEAVIIARKAQKAGLSFDSGMMQVNNWWLEKLGIPLDAAFDPAANIWLGSWILGQEVLRHGRSWSAVGRYHSPDPEKASHYVELVKKALAQSGKRIPEKKKASQPSLKNSSQPRIVDTDTHAQLVVYRSPQSRQESKKANFIEYGVQTE